MNDANACPDAETLAAFADGRLPRTEIAPLLAHLDGCPRCMRAVASAGDQAQARPSARRWPWIAVAAALLAVFATLFALRDASPEERLARLAPRSARVVEPRLSGDFAWAPWRGPMRAGDAAPDPRRLQLAGAAGELVARADRERSADAQHDAGIALLLIEQPLAAAARLGQAAAREPNARVWSDLAAAKYAAATRLGRPSLHPEALADADRALRSDPHFAPALFNRALILESLGLTTLAREAWERYLAVDASSPWANEARAHLARLPRTTVESEFRGVLPRLEQAAVAGENLDAFVARYPTHTRVFAEAEHLGLWAEAELRGDAAGADRKLALARATADALVRVSGESLLRDAVAAIDVADARRRRTLASAHQIYRRGRMAYGRQQPTVAERDLREAARHFADGGSAMALVARYYAACTRYDGNDVDGAQAELEQLLAEVDRRAHYVALGAQVRWQLALCLMSRDDWIGALPVVTRAEEAFHRLGERANAGFVQTLLADTLLCLGRLDESWSARIESFRAQSAEGRSDRLPVSIGGAARMELRAGRLDAARALLALEAAADRAAGSEHLLANVHTRAALVAIAAGDGDAAAAHAREAAATAARIADPGLRSRGVADARLAEGAALLDDDPRRAHDALTAAIESYERSGRTHFLAEAHLLRGRARLRQNDAAGAEEELARGIARVASGGGDSGIFDAGRALHREAIALALERRDAAAAFAYAERSHARGGAIASAGEVQRRLRGSGAAVVQIVALADGVATLCVTENGVAFARRRLPRVRLEALADAAARGELPPRATLYDLLLREPRSCLAGARRLIVVADPVLDGVAFAALYDSAARAYLIERLPVSLALSASSLRPAVRARPRSVLAIELPSGEKAGTVALPRAARELADVRALYARSGGGAAEADVIHVAGHTSRQSRAAAIGAREPRAGATVVLAACETLRRPRASALSLGGSFLAAGAGDVIGTLDLIADEDAYELFSAVHRALASGIAADEAVRRAQLAAIATRGAPGWSALAVLTRRIPPQEGDSTWSS